MQSRRISRTPRDETLTSTSRRTPRVTTAWLQRSDLVSRTAPTSDVPAHVASGPFIVDGHTIPQGTLVGIITYAIHRNSAYFPEPFKFQPERWLPKDDERGSGEFTDAQRKLMHDAFNPFSTGTRGCAGKHLAYAEIGIVQAKLLWYFDFIQVKGRLDIQEFEFQTRDQLIASH
ncbi:cytochrome P450 [Periconia macrospinosa]|uniref:Cytochrome P450 n=1 Tax=Periconia macrospinosa TaxID=97972 RepID=A0A2V1D8B7_9PLEO|nr:cytochrome P450 [Periconia macrospinosa]